VQRRRATKGRAFSSGCPGRRATQGFVTPPRDEMHRRLANSFSCRATRWSDGGRRCAHDMLALVAHRRMTMGAVVSRRRALSHDENGSYEILIVPMDFLMAPWIP